MYLIIYRKKHQDIHCYFEFAAQNSIIFTFFFFLILKYIFYKIYIHFLINNIIIYISINMNIIPSFYDLDKNNEYNINFKKD